jgi:hypothetical protein
MASTICLGYPPNCRHLGSMVPRQIPTGAPVARSARCTETLRLRRYTSFTFLSGRSRTGLPVAAKIAFITAGVTTQMVGSPTPPQKS